VSTTLGVGDTEELLGRLRTARIGHVTFAETDELTDAHDAVVELGAHGGWVIHPARAGALRAGKHPGAA
jgi:hypothetical protein